MTWRCILPSLKHMSSEVAELGRGPRCSVSSAAEDGRDAFDEQKIFVTTKEDLRQVTADVPVVMQRQVPVMRGFREQWIFHWSSTLTRKNGNLRWLCPDGETQVTIEHVPKEVVRLIPQERVQQRTVEQIVHVPVPGVVEEMTEVVQITRSVPRSVSSTESSMCQL